MADHRIPTSLGSIHVTASGAGDPMSVKECAEVDGIHCEVFVFVTCD